MRIKKNDTVKILVGKDRGKSGKVIKVMPAKLKGQNGKIVVEGVNLRYKHMRPRREREKGQRIMFPYPLEVSNAVLVCPRCGQATRVGFKIFDKASETVRERKQRVCGKCRNVI